MPNFQLAGEFLTASLNDRTLRYRLLPFGSTGQTSIGRVTASKGAVTFPEDVSGLPVNLEHDYKQPVGKFSSIEETDEGLFATVSIANTTAGNDALELAASGLRTGISVELGSVQVRSGVLTAGTLTGAGLCVRPAFADAQLMASDFGDLEETPTDSSEPEEPEVENADAEAEAEPLIESESDMSETAAVPTALNAAANAAPALSPALIAQAYANKDVRLAASLEDAGLAGEQNLFAALSPVTSTANTANVEQSQWLGEMWTGKSYTRKYVNLVNTGSLTSWKIEGWKFVTKPQVGDYAGDLAEIPTNTVVTEHFSEEAQRIAGGWKLDRKYKDFSNTEFISSFFKAATEDYARKSDAKVIEFIKANATAVTGTVVPAGVSPTAAKIVNGALEMIDFADPSFVIVGKAAFKEYMNTTEFDNLKFISQTLGFTGGNVNGIPVIVSADVAPDDVYVGAKEAVTFYELPGTPIQVSALDISHGGEDEALFGYYALVLNDARGLIKVS